MIVWEKAVLAPTDLNSYNNNNNNQVSLVTLDNIYMNTICLQYQTIHTYTTGWLQY